MNKTKNGAVNRGRRYIFRKDLRSVFNKPIFQFYGLILCDVYTRSVVHADKIEVHAVEETR